MTILEKIKQYKLKEIEQIERNKSIYELQREPYLLREIYSLKQRLQDETQSGIIAEFKRASPSKGIIHQNANVKRITTGYKKAKVSGLSVLTDAHFFQAQKKDRSRHYLALHHQNFQDFLFSYHVKKKFTYYFIL